MGPGVGEKAVPTRIDKSCINYTFLTPHFNQLYAISI